MTKQNNVSSGISVVFTEIYDGASNAVNVPGAPYDKFDILYVAFAHIAQQTFELDFENVQNGGKVAEKERLQNILNLVAPLRASGSIKVCISLGWGDQYNDIPLIEQNLSTFAPSVKALLQANDLDGFDIDYEEPTFTSNASFQAVSQAIRAALGNDHLFTITPNNSTNLDGNTLNTYYDYVNVQSYDYNGDFPCPVTKFTSMPGLSHSKILAGADTDNGDDISSAIDKYVDNNIGGVFAWKLGTNFSAIADAMWNATHGLKQNQ